MPARGWHLSRPNGRHGAYGLNLAVTLSLCLAGVLPAGPAVRAAAGAQVPRVVVEDVRPSGTAARAGLRPGDVLSDWTTATSAGVSVRAPSTSPTCRPVRTVRPRHVAGHAQRRPSHGGGGRRRMARRDARRPARGRRGVVRGGTCRGGERRCRRGDVRLRGLAEIARSRGDREASAYLHARRGRVLAVTERWEAARQAFAASRDAAPSDLDRARLFEAESRALAVSRPTDAMEALRRAVELRRRVSPGSLALAGDLAALARLVRDTGELFISMEALAREGLEMAEAVSPGSLVAAQCIDELLWVVASRSTEDGRALLDRALAARQRLAPDSEGMARSLEHRGRDGLAQERPRGRHRRVDARPRDAAPPGTRRSGGGRRSLNNISLSAGRQGDHAGAESFSGAPSPSRRGRARAASTPSTCS